jgi:signal transduction histidine kinase
VAKLAVPTLGDRCDVDLLDTGSRGGSVEAEADSAENGHTELLQQTKQRLTAEAVATAHIAKFEAQDGVDVAGIAVPLLASGRVLGTLTCLRVGLKEYDEAEVSLATELGQRVALAADNVELYLAAQRAIYDRDEFLSVAAHELKTPITSLRGYAQLALRRMEMGDERLADHTRKALEVIESQSGKLTRLVSQLLDLSRLEAGRLRLSRERVDLVPVVHTLADRTRMMSDRHEVSVDTPPTAIARVDVLRFEQVLTNLLDNAVKFSPGGGPVQVVLSIAAGNTVRISVEDRGVGIPPEHRGQIFERFHQAHDELQPYLAGMGLGLYISRQIVELHGGSINAEFPEEGGVRFVIQLPVDGGEHSSAHC